MNPRYLRGVGSASVLIMWLKLFYFLRLFRPTAAFMNLILTTIKDMSIFAFILTLAFLGFGNAFYIMAVNKVMVNYDGTFGEPREVLADGT